ncbi:hypothetical protein [Kroppenstedtia eburnea]|uniref:Uncharacterized protein n=1 Tax=Kroppenstedtia eburnea TaxID=714067 RepID=A0A1N7LLL7_9BACL|nr:hypothetical protein [Kroppenstedtia eburnea]EGK08145.1 hypothetical protein HMPREF9374_3485 [Desmospora sp. 8437]QKI81271.1 hypothetical protein GXN75_04250 [Kroppenstedtia eburnea]SIS74730.1 hypothetical protein SAMN05421790_104252 [Kroppenstedtia eburnea]
MEEIERWLMFSYWGSYLKEDYMQVGLDVTEVLMKHWGQVEWLRGTLFSYDEGLKDVDSFDKIRDEVLSNQKRYRLYDVTFFNPTVTEEIYVNRLDIFDAMLTIQEYDDLKYFQTEDPALNEQRTRALLEVFTDVASLPAIEELWMPDRDLNAFMGHPAYLYRPRPLYERVEDSLYTLKTKDEVTRLVEEFHTYVPMEWVIDYLQDHLGADAVQVMADGKVRVLFYDRELTKSKVDTREFLNNFEADVDRFCREKGVTLYKGEAS